MRTKLELTLRSQLMPSGRVRDSWKDDALFGYQFLNGANPMLLRRSKSLPARLVLPPEMQDLQTQLEKELQVRSCLCLYLARHCSLPSSPSPPSFLSFVCTSTIYTHLHLHLEFLF